MLLKMYSAGVVGWLIVSVCSVDAAEGLLLLRFCSKRLSDCLDIQWIDANTIAIDAVVFYCDDVFGLCLCLC